MYAMGIPERCIVKKKLHRVGSEFPFGQWIADFDVINSRHVG
jgi:hypothetical protein